IYFTGTKVYWWLMDMISTKPIWDKTGLRANPAKTVGCQEPVWIGVQAELTGILPISSKRYVSGINPSSMVRSKRLTFLRVWRIWEILPIVRDGFSILIPSLRDLSTILRLINT